MSETGKIYGAINQIMEEIGAIGKDKRNASQGFNYRGVDDVMNVLQPLLVKHHVAIVPDVVDHRREERESSKGSSIRYAILTIRYTFLSTEDGSSLSVTVIGEGMDSGDKASNKAMSVAFKYACFQVFCIPTEEMKDPDEETPPPVKPAKEPQPESPKAYYCEMCGNEIGEVKGKSGSPMKPEVYAAAVVKKRGRLLCPQCAEAMDTPYPPPVV